MSSGGEMGIVRSFLNDEAGAMAIEYGLIGVLVSIVIVAASVIIGNETTTLFSTISNAIMGALGN